MRWLKEALCTCKRGSLRMQSVTFLMPKCHFLNVLTPSFASCARHRRTRKASMPFIMLRLTAASLIHS